MRKVFITEYSSISAIGSNRNEILKNLKLEKDLIYYPNKDEKFKLPYFKVDSLKKRAVNRCSDFALELLSSIEESWLDKKPVPLFVATSTGGIAETEDNFNDLLTGKFEYSIFKKHYLNCIADDIKRVYKDKVEPLYTISTACSSSAQALLKAFCYIKNGVIDRALVVGVDSISLTTMIGFDSLRLVSHTRTTPLAAERDGLSLGEGGAVLLLESDNSKAKCEILSVKSSSDGYHISSPDPEGQGQAKAIKMALEEAGITIDQIDYINAHGTGTLMNDEVEIKVIKSIFKKNIAVSSIKGLVGHTLGASAAVDLAILLDMLRDGVIYNNLFGKKSMDIDYIPEGNIEKDINYFIKNSFGFGGNNVSMVLKNLFRG